MKDYDKEIKKFIRMWRTTKRGVEIQRRREFIKDDNPEEIKKLYEYMIEKNYIY